MGAKFRLQLATKWADVPLELGCPLEKSVAGVKGDKLLRSDVLGAAGLWKTWSWQEGVFHRPARVNPCQLTLVAINPTP
jgi:hypothetical protein